MIGIEALRKESFFIVENRFGISLERIQHMFLQLRIVYIKAVNKIRKLGLKIWPAMLWLFLIILILYLLWWEIRPLKALEIWLVFKEYFPIINPISAMFPTDTIIRLLTALGLVNTFLSAVHAAKEKFIDGIPVSDILSFYYPNRDQVYHLQAYFFVYGIITANAGYRHMAIIAFLCAVLCFLYLLKMAQNIVYSETKKKLKARSYVEDRMKEVEKVPLTEKYEDHYNAYKLVWLLSEDISSNIVSSRSEEKIDFLVKKVINRRQQENCAEGISLFASFDKVFTDPQNDENIKAPQSEKWLAILYGFPEWDRARKTFVSDIMGSCQAWRILLGEGSNVEKRRKLFLKVLSTIRPIEETAEAQLNFPAFLCGFLEYILSDAEGNIRNNISSNLVWQSIQQEYLNMIRDEKRVFIEQEQKIIKICEEMSLILICAFVFTEVFSRSEPQPIQECPLKDIVMAVKTEQKRNYVTEKEIQIAIVYACMILCALDLEDSVGIFDRLVFRMKLMVPACEKVQDIVKYMVN